MTPLFVVSLDFELHWGVRDVYSVEQWREQLLGERIAVVALLDLFRRRSIRATWATVGALFCGSKRELLASMPERTPNYEDPKLSPYPFLHELGEDESSDPFHFAPSLVAKIAATPGQEVATHTFSHFYCLERGQTEADFVADLAAARRVGSKFGDVTRSLVFPRNQFNAAYVDAMRRHGVETYRSNGPHWAYVARTTEEPLHRRAFRLGDAYLPLAGARSRRVVPDPGHPVDVPASAFLRPYHPRLRFLDRARYHRIAGAMTRAARRGECFHLWWHPSNFGTHLGENLRFLDALLDHLEVLRARYGMESASMVDAVS